MSLSLDETGKIINTHLQPVVQHITDRGILERALEKALKDLAEKQSLVEEIKGDLAEFDRLTGSANSENQTPPANTGGTEVVQ